MKLLLLCCTLTVFCNANEVILDLENITPIEAHLTGSDVGRGRYSPGIIGGTTAERTQFPFQAALVIDNSAFCGGSLVSTSWVLTAGHCAKGVKTWMVFLGAHNLEAASENGRTVILANKAVVHPLYSESTLKNDIALLKLSSPAPINAYVRPVKLPNFWQSFVSFNYRKATVSGWGQLSDSAKGKLSPKLQSVDLRVISNWKCSWSYGPTVLSNAYLCCNGLQRQGVCFGDSGGPLVTSDRGVYIQIGVVSFTNAKGCEAGQPSGFARVGYYRDWILKTAGTLN